MVHRFLTRAIRFLDDGAFDGELAKRLGGNIIPGLGEWPSPENMTRDRGIILPSTIASQAQANVGDTLDSLTFAYVVDESTLVEGSITDENCDGEITPENNEMIYCRMWMTVEDLKVVGKSLGILETQLSLSIRYLPHCRFLKNHSVEL